MTRLPQSMVFAALLLAPSLVLVSAASAQDFDAQGEQAMLARINAMRAAQNRTPLIRHPALDAAARAHSSDMATQQQLTHVSDSSGTPADRVRAAGVESGTVSENVALHRTAADAQEALVGSDSHRNNMLAEDATHVGIAALRTAQGVYVTQVFAAIQPQAPAVAEAPPAPPAPPAPSVQPAPQPEPRAVTAPLPPPPAPPAAGPSPARRPQPQGPQPQANLQVQPGTNGTVVIAREAGQVVAYWVYGNGRWWYYPFPPGAQAGQQLQADLSVTGPPPGFPEHPGGAPAPPPPPQRNRVLLSPAPPPPAPPARGRTVLIQPYGGAVQVAPGATFYAVPPPPLVGPPTRAWRRAHRRWQRQQRRWRRGRGRRL